MPPGGRQPMFSDHRNFPIAVLKILPKQGSQRRPRMIPGHDVGRLPDRAACSSQPKIQFIVLVPNKRFIEIANLLKNLTPPASQVNRVHAPFVGGLVPSGADRKSPSLHS